MVDLEKLEALEKAATPGTWANSKFVAAFRNAARELIDELRELRRDKERLDWLERQLTEHRYRADFAFQSDEEDGVWFARIHRLDCGELRNSNPLAEEHTETVREALDAAMKQAAVEEKPNAEWPEIQR